MTVGVNTTDINDIILNDGKPSGEGDVGWGEFMQVVGPGGNPEAMYSFYAKMMDPSGTVETDFYWGDDQGNPVSVAFDSGDGIAIDNPNGTVYQIFNAGQVPNMSVSFPARSGLNWSGNPFPATINLNAVMLDDGKPSGEGDVGWGEFLQIVGPGGNPDSMYSFYAKMMDPTGTVETDFYWGDDQGNPVDVTLPAGAGFAIDNPNGTVYDIKITCPYSL